MRSSSRRWGARVMLAWSALAPLALATPARAGAPCLQEPVELRRFARPREPVRVSLTTCAGTPHGPAIEALSLLARDKRVPRPTAETLRAHREAHAGSAEIAPGILRLDPQLLVRLQALATRFPGRTLVIVSGHRPRARRTSRHRVGRALDIAVEGIDRSVVAGFLRRLPATGVGYYPNSTFTHVDVRATRAYWVDHSGPGERPRYARVEAGEPPPEGTPAQPAAAPTRARRARLRSQADDAARGAAREAPTAAGEAPPAGHAPPRTTAPLPAARDDEVDWTLPP